MWTRNGMTVSLVVGEHGALTINFENYDKDIGVDMREEQAPINCATWNS